MEDAANLEAFGSNNFENLCKRSYLNEELKSRLNAGFVLRKRRP